MIENIKDIIEAIEKHEYAGLIKLGLVENDSEAIFHYHPQIKEDFFNRVRRIRSSDTSLENLIKRIRSFYGKFCISPVISFNPLTTPVDLDKFLIKKGNKQNIIHVFVYEKQEGIIKNQSDLVISETNDVDEFVEIYGLTFTNDSSNSIKEKIRINFSSDNNLHLVARLNDNLIGSVGSIGFEGVYVIYGLSISQEYRGNGFGNVLGDEIIRRLFAKRPKLIYFKSKNPLVINNADRFGFRKVYEQIYFQI